MKVYRLSGIEEGVGYVSCSVGKDLSWDILNALELNAPLSDLWAEHVRDFAKELDLPFANFTTLVGPPCRFLVCCSDIHGDQGFLMHTLAGDEFLQMPGLEVQAVAYHCRRLVDAAHPTLTQRPGGVGGPLLLRDKVPPAGFFRLSGFFSELYFSEPPGGGFKKWFDASGLVGVEFRECNFAD